MAQRSSINFSDRKYSSKSLQSDFNYLLANDSILDSIPPQNSFPRRNQSNDRGTPIIPPMDFGKKYIFFTTLPF